jgi:hypothetical protein
VPRRCRSCPVPRACDRDNSGFSYAPDAEGTEQRRPPAAGGTYRGCVTTVAERLRETRAKSDNALDLVRSDQSASPVLIAVVDEFAKKAEKATRAEDERAAVIELEQAGDSAKAAAEADTGISDATRQAILDAHLAICIAKAKL